MYAWACVFRLHYARTTTCHDVLTGMSVCLSSLSTQSSRHGCGSNIVIELAQVVQSQNTDMNIGGTDNPLNDVAFLTSRSQSIQIISFKTKTEH